MTGDGCAVTTPAECDAPATRRITTRFGDTYAACPDHFDRVMRGVEPAGPVTVERIPRTS